MKGFAILAAASALVTAAPAWATTTIDFEAQAPGYQTNPLTIGDVTFATLGSGLYVSDYANGTGNSLCPTVSGSFCDASLDLSFASAVSGLSFLYAGVDFTESTIDVLLTYFGGGTALLSFTPIASNGVIDMSAYSNIIGASISTTDGAGLSYDNFTYNISGAVPEPATWGMMLLGFLGIGWSLRTRARRTLAAA